MPFVAVPNVVMAEVRMTLDSQEIENRVMIDTLAAVTPTVVENVANVVDNWAQSHYFHHLPNAVALRETVATDLTVIDGSQFTLTPSGSVTGALTNAAMPNEVSFCVKLLTGFRGRSARGRFYVAALQVPDVTANTLAVGRANTFVDDLNALRDAATTEGWNFCIVSYRTGNAPRVGGPVKFSVTSASFTDLIVDSMRRRKPGVGR